MIFRAVLRLFLLVNEPSKTTYICILFFNFLFKIANQNQTEQYVYIFLKVNLFDLPKCVHMYSMFVIKACIDDLDKILNILSWKILALHIFAKESYVRLIDNYLHLLYSGSFLVCFLIR